MLSLQEIKNKVISGYAITRSEAEEIYNAPLEELCSCADEIRSCFCGKSFDVCTITNAKSGKCSENCKFCAQSAFYFTGAETYPIKGCEKIVAEAKKNAEKGILRFSLVTSGKALNDAEIEEMCRIIKEIRREADISVCVSFGLLNEGQFKRLKDAGAERVHCNIETSERFFPEVCTTHSFSDKLKTIDAARNAGLEICSGGIFGLGETVADRIDMAFTLKKLNIKSVPMNVLNPIPGTPFEKNIPLTNDEVRRIIAVFRFILPDAAIRLAGGRGLMQDKGRSCFKSGANAAISGDMLTTSGISINDDFNILSELCYTAEKL